MKERYDEILKKLGEEESPVKRKDSEDLEPDLDQEPGIRNNIEWFVLTDIQGFYDSLSPLSD